MTSRLAKTGPAEDVNFSTRAGDDFVTALLQVAHVHSRHYLRPSKKHSRPAQLYVRIRLPMLMVYAGIALLILLALVIRTLFRRPPKVDYVAQSVLNRIRADYR